MNTPSTVLNPTLDAWQDTPDYLRFRQQVQGRTGIDLTAYKPQQMHRRLLSLLERSGDRTFAAYFDRLERDPIEYALFLDWLTINVTEWFRNPEKWRELQTSILPALLATARPLRLWSAGCSHGAEAYTLALLLHQTAPKAAYTLHATDLDRNILQRARAGCFAQSELNGIPPDLLAAYFAPCEESAAAAGKHWQIAGTLRQHVVFREHNLLADPFEGDYDLICCRNVVIYFTDAAKERLFTRFAAALRPGGILFVGGTERIFNASALDLEIVAPFFYRRL